MSDYCECGANPYGPVPHTPDCKNSWDRKADVEEEEVDTDDQDECEEVKWHESLSEAVVATVGIVCMTILGVVVAAVSPLGWMTAIILYMMFNP